MKSFEIILTPASQKDIYKFSPEVVKEIFNDIKILKENPFSIAGSKIKKLKTLQQSYRLRVGDYRVIYKMEKSKIIVLRIIDRKELERVLKDIR